MQSFLARAALGCLCITGNVFGDSSSISVPLQRTGADPDASGLVAVNLSPITSSLTVLTTNLAPSQVYSVLSRGLYRGSFVADANGRGRVKFARPAVSGALPLTFDPRGAELLVWRRGAAILRAVVSGAGEPARSSVTEIVDLHRLAGSGAATATARYRLLPDGTRRFSTTLSNVADGDWDLYVDGLFRGEIDVQNGTGRLAFDNVSSTLDLPLNFDPRDKRVEVARSGELFFSAFCEAKANGVNVALPTVVTRFIPSTAVDPDGFACTRFRVDRGATRRLHVELEDVPAGAYELLADGVVRGTIQVVATSQGTEGEIEFSSVPDDEDELPLNFNALLASYEVRLAGTSYFRGLLTTSIPYVPDNQGPLFLRESLTSTGLDTDASGEARYEIDDQGRHKFTVAFKDVPADVYELWVGAVMRRMTAVVDLNGVTEAQIEFISGPPWLYNLLTFEPRGTSLEVKGAAGTVFSHFFGVGATNGAFAPPLEIELPLFSLGQDDNGTAKVQFKRDDRGRRHFEVELRDVAIGEYALLVDNAWLINITVVATPNGPRGEIEFEDEPEPGELLLTFDPLGTTIAIERNDGVRYFERTLPARPCQSPDRGNHCP